MAIAGIGVLAALFHATVAAHGSVALTERPVVRIIVQTEGTSLERGVLSEMLRMAGDIWRPYADVSFDLAGDTNVSARALRLVVTDRLSAVSDSASLGWIEFVDGRPTGVMTVSTAAAVMLLKASRWNGLAGIVRRTFLERALGRAVAHELGHYLLASRDHAAHGLMRGQLTADDIMLPRRSSYRLDRGQVQSLQRRALVARGGDSDEAAETVRP